MKKLGFLLAVVLMAQNAVATPAGTHYINVAAALAESAVAASWAAQPQTQAAEIDESKLAEQVATANEKLNEELEARLAKRLEAAR